MHKSFQKFLVNDGIRIADKFPVYFHDWIIDAVDRRKKEIVHLKNYSKAGPAFAELCRVCYLVKKSFVDRGIKFSVTRPHRYPEAPLIDLVSMRNPRICSNKKSA